MPAHSHQILPSGKVVVKNFANSGALLREQHTYGSIDIGLACSYANGIKVEELYFLNKRMVSRATYEKARAKYPDMPPADSTLEDTGKDLLNLAAQERKKLKQAAKTHKPDSKVAAEAEAFCQFLLEQGKRADAVEWVKDKNHTLGEMNSTQSKRLVCRLIAMGCKQVIACKIDQYDDGLENTGHLVVELPEDTELRKKIFPMLSKTANRIGYDGPMDDRQKYEYVKLD